MAEDQAEPEDEELDQPRIDAVLAAVEAGDARRSMPCWSRCTPPTSPTFWSRSAGPTGARFCGCGRMRSTARSCPKSRRAIREEVIEALPREVLAEAVRDLETDDVVDILEDLEQPQQEAILDALEDADRVAVEQAMAYPEYSAGRLMQRETVVAPGTGRWARRSTSCGGRCAAGPVLPCDPGRPADEAGGLCHAGAHPVVRARGEAARHRRGQLSHRSRRPSPEADVAYIFNQYHLISCPVVDAGGRLVGVITIDDAMNVLDEEHEEDMLRLAGVGEEADVSDGPVETVGSGCPGWW
jgi:magnesium transporter